MVGAITLGAEWLGYSAAVCGGLLACLSLVLPGRSWPRLMFALGMGLLAAEVLFSTLSYDSVSLTEAAAWQGLRVLVLCLIPVTWLSFSLVFARGNAREFLYRWWPGLLAALLLPVGTIVIAKGRLIDAVIGTDGGFWFGLGSRGMLLHGMVLLGYVMVLVNLERTLRAAVGVMRWRIKLVVVGLALYFVVGIYATSQKLLYHGWSTSLDVLYGPALLAAAGLITWSAVRSGLREADVYPSRSIILGSVTFVLAGIYLVLLGLLAKAVGVLGWTRMLPLQASIVLGGLATLGLILASDHRRQRLELVLSRHFRRPSFDYRNVWTRFTERCASELEEASFCGVSASFVSEIFHTLSVTIWLLEGESEPIRFGGSTVLSEAQAADLLGGGRLSASAWREIEQYREFICIDGENATGLREWQAVCPAQFQQTGGNLGMLPLRGRGKLVGLLVLADRVGGSRYSIEERDLLNTLGLEIGATLLNLRLLQRQLDARQSDSLRTMAAFFAHDLKNTGSTLKLTLQNLRKHFGNPEFREDALHAISRSVDDVNRIVEGLSTLQQELKLNVCEEDLNSLVHQVLVEMKAAMPLDVESDLHPVPRLAMDVQQFKKVLINLLLNARDAVSNAGRVSVQTGVQEKWVWLSVKDDGCGIQADFIRRSLFQPFQTTKKKGLGIGMFQSKKIVEAHGGRIEVESQVGLGTTFRVLLPMPETMH